MKYNKQWHEDVSHLTDIRLRKECISYKRWKKRNLCNNEYIDILENELRNANQIFKERIKRILCQLDCKGNVSDDTKRLLKDIVLFADITRTTLYKISKRFSKRWNDSKYIDWYNVLLKGHVYKILGSSELSLLKRYVKKVCDIDSDCDSNLECPVCLRDVDNILDGCLILKCGHWICYDCAMRVHMILGKRGTIWNIVQYNTSMGLKIECPMCRYDNPYNDFSVYPLWKAKDIKTGIEHIIFSSI